MVRVVARVVDLLAISCVRAPELRKPSDLDWL